MRVQFVCRSYLSRIDTVRAPETDMGGFLWRAFVACSNAVAQCTARRLFVFSQNNDVVKGTLRGQTAKDAARAGPKFELSGAVGDPCVRPKAWMGPCYRRCAESVQ